MIILKGNFKEKKDKPSKTAEKLNKSDIKSAVVTHPKDASNLSKPIKHSKIVLSKKKP